MQSYRVNNPLPQVYRTCRVAPTQTTRKMAFFPRYVQSEFAPMFRLLDDFASYKATSPACSSNFRSLQSFTPRFDVKEDQESYTLTGELPGIAQQDVEVNFTDAHTLQIKGRSERQREEGTRPAAAVEASTEQPKLTADTEATNETESYHKASVEDDFETVEAPASSTADATPTPASEETAESSTQNGETKAVEQQPKTPNSKYWISERSVGQFARTFSFPSRVDQENVKASLKDGILSIIVPKAPAPQNKRINIE